MPSASAINSAETSKSSVGTVTVGSSASEESSVASEEESSTTSDEESSTTSEEESYTTSDEESSTTSDEESSASEESVELTVPPLILSS